MSRPRISPRPSEVATLTTQQIRAAFLVENVFTPDGRIEMTFTDLDRLAVGGARPGQNVVVLDNDRETGSEFFLARRELGMINVGAPGTVTADGKEFNLGNLDGLYVSMGTRDVRFKSRDPAQPAKFFLLSAPAHAAYPTTLIEKNKITPRAIGAPATANQRKIHQYIVPGAVKSCQLDMGFTELAEGSVWNTMPPHTHSRRSEIYFYFDLPGDNLVSHFMGEPTATKSIWVRNNQAVLSPPWSIHCGCGTSAYRFIWAMAGENQVYDDMDKVAPADLR